MALLMGVTALGLYVPIRLSADGKLYIVELPPLPTGTNVIGDIGNVGSITTLPSLPTGTNKIGNIGTVDSVTALPAISLAADQNVQARGYQWSGSAWQKAPFPFGFSSMIDEAKLNTNLGAGSNNVDSTAVPAGSYYYITQAAIKYTGTIGSVTLTLLVLGTTTATPVMEQGTITSAKWYMFNGPMILGEGAQLRLAITNATAGDDGELRYCGSKVLINQ